MLRTQILTLLLVYLTDGQLVGIYCDEQSCFDVLRVSRDADTVTVQRAYRSLAKEFHPDRQKTTGEKVRAEETFRLIATAYEILRDPEQRQEYEYMLDHPTEMYYHYYRYYKRRYSPKIDVRLVCLSTIFILSAIQYISQKTKHNQALAFLVRDPKYRTKAKELANAEKRFQIAKQKVGRRLTKDEIKAYEEAVIRSVIAENFELRGDCGPPSIRNTLVVQLVILPYHILRFCWWALRWIVLFTILRRPYGPEEKEYLTRRRLGYNQSRWDSLDEGSRAYYNHLELWRRENFKAYREVMEEEIRVRASEDTNQKRYRRYVKRYGPPTVTNPDDS
ncbi:DnaJ -like protein [Echinococcus granulosus]|nr:DnaJ -like protein [Echinococcus granulosus]